MSTGSSGTNAWAWSAWRRLFAESLIKLRPDMNPDLADEASDTAWSTMSSLPPEHAAERYTTNETSARARVATERASKP